MTEERGYRRSLMQISGFFKWSSLCLIWSRVLAGFFLELMHRLTLEAFLLSQGFLQERLRVQDHLA